MPGWLHLPTLTVAFTLAYAGGALFMGLMFADHRRFPGAGFWIAGQVSLALGAVCVALQAHGLPYDVLAVSNVALLASATFMGHGVWKFRFGPGFPTAVYSIIPVGLSAWFLLKGFGVSVLVVAFSGALGVLSGVVAVLLALKPKSGDKRLRAWALAYFGIVSLTGFARAIGTLIGSTPQTIALDGGMGAFEYALSLVVTFANMYTYSVMSAAQVEQELRATEREIRKRNEELVETVDTKDALISVLGHDLRAPVWSATRYVRGHLVEYKGDLNAKRESIETLAEGLERISSLLDSLLEWSLCASGRLKFDSSPVHLAAAVEEAVSDIKTAAKAKSVSVEVYLDDSLVAGDMRALATVFRNLLSNAVKYSKRGDTIEVRGRRTHSQPPRLIVEVRDHGIGMKPEQMAKLFVPGRTILTLGTDGEQGKGFGLAISKLFVDAMGGSLEVESSPGVGTTFMMEFPIAPPL